MTTLIITVSLVLAAGVAGFWAGVKHSEKARTLKDFAKKF
jgi:ABC-type antimicrobial peptide transport system permease subunit